MTINIKKIFFPITYPFKSQINMSKIIKLFEQFDSYEEFSPIFEKYCKDNFVNVQKADSAHFKNENKENIGINYIVFKCVHFQDPATIKSKGNGERPQQKYNALNCPFSLRFAWSVKAKPNACFVITKFNDSHNNTHPCTEDYYNRYINNNKPSEAQTELIKGMYEAKAKPALIQQSINKQFNTKINQRQIYNIGAQLLKDNFNGEEDEIKKIEAFIEERIKIDGTNNFDLSYDTSGGEKK